MNDFFNAFWREFQYKIVDLIVYLANHHPLVAWIILYFLGLLVLYFCFKFIRHCYIIYNKSKNIKILKIGISFFIPIVIVFYFIVKFTIYKSNGYLVYFCIFSLISTISVIFGLCDLKNLYQINHKIETLKNKRSKKLNLKK